ncbi:hypothetical protein H0H87_009688 [Tephrocybe sp. NHM501043]|nr:hypothetical protein H0H87_009688 [Tephrocybe sp. NHM501043]
MPVTTTASLDVDPLAKVLEPPSDETEMERDARLSAEAKAKRISEGIDEELEREKAAENKGAKALKMLLLGQSESGKSTTLKNLQLLFDPVVSALSVTNTNSLIDHLKQTFREERASWRAVVQLNIVRSVHLILDAITQPNTELHSDLDQLGAISPDLLKLKLRLRPLLQIEQVLIRRLTPEGSAERETPPHNHHSSKTVDRPDSLNEEVAIHSARPWKEISSGALQRADRAKDWTLNDPHDPGIILSACAQDMMLLWNNPTVRALLKARNIHMEEVAGL